MCTIIFNTSTMRSTRIRQDLLKLFLLSPLLGGYSYWQRWAYLLNAQRKQSASWGTLSDNKVSWGTLSDSKVSWGTLSDNKVSWGTLSDNKVSWGTLSDNKVSWGTLSETGILLNGS